MARLNREQTVAATHRGGHAVVLAGPGTGKTTTLAGRHAFLRSLGRHPDGIAVVTFTQKAAAELRARLGGKVGADAWIGTFHGLSRRLLKRFHSEAGLRRNFRVLDPGEQRQLLADLGIRWEGDDGDIVDIIGRWKDSMISPGEAATRAAGANGDGSGQMRLAAQHYEAYEEEIARRGDLDFADLLLKALPLLRDNETVGRFVSDRFTDVLVDEFQDVNLVQCEFVHAMAARGCDVWAVADDDQALYGWRGGDVRLTVNFAQRFPGASTYTLSENYRCDPAILAAANALISVNRTRVRKSLKATRSHVQGNVVRVRGFKTERDEADWIAGEIGRRIATGTRPRDICILFRTASVTPAIQQALEVAGIPFALTGASNFWEMPELLAVADLLSEIASGVAGQGAARSRAARDIVSTMSGATPAEAAPAVGRIVAETPPQGCTSERASLWSDTAEAAAAIARGHVDAESFRAHVSAMAGKASADGADAVAMTTIHSSKGLEWGYVAIAGGEATLMPHHRAPDVEEERRLLYVALTRSKGAVDLTLSRVRFGRSQAPSPFIAEMAKAPKGAVVWVGAALADDRANPARGSDTAAGPDARPQAQAGIKVYRKRGGRSLIPPGEE